MNKTFFIIAVIIALVVGGWVVFSGNDSSPQKTANNIAQDGNFDQVPGFTLEDWDGNKVSLSDFEGRPLIINSWAVWCPFCVDELVDFVKLQEELGDSAIIIAIDRAESTEKQKKFTDELGVTSGLIFLNDPDDSFYQSIGGFSMPETLFVDKDGNIILHKRGPMDIDEMRNIVKDIL